MTIPSGPYIPLPDNTEIIKQRVQTTALNTLKLNDSELGGSGEVVTIQSLNGAVEIFTESGSINDSLVRTSAMQAALTAKQDAAAFLTTLVGIGGTSGSGNLARVVAPTFSGTMNTGGITASTGSLIEVLSASSGTIYMQSGDLQWKNHTLNQRKLLVGSNANGMILDATNMSIRWSANTDVFSSPRTGISENGAGVISLDTTARNNALGSLACATATLTDTFTVSIPGTIGGLIVAAGSIRTGRAGSWFPHFFDTSSSSGRFGLATSSAIAWSGNADGGSATVTSHLSQQSAGVVQIGTTAANALGSLACANVTASGTVTGGLAATPGTFAVVNATTATATLGLRRITDRSNRLAYPDGTNWRFVSDDAIIS